MKNMDLMIASTGEALELSLIGIDDASKPPSLTHFPPKFSPNGFTVWRALLDSPGYLYYVSNHHTLSERWKWMVYHYIQDCEKRGLFPWRISAEQSKTDVATYLLSAARRQLKTYFKRVGLFKLVQIRPMTKATSRAYIFKKDSFEIKITALLDPIKDPSFKTWLVKPNNPGFRATGHAGVFFRRLYESTDSVVIITMNVVNAQHPVLTVNIKFKHQVTLPYHGRPLSKPYIVNFVEENIWLPIVRSYRFDNAGWRLF